MKLQRFLWSLVLTIALFEMVWSDDTDTTRKISRIVFEEKQIEGKRSTPLILITAEQRPQFGSMIAGHAESILPLKTLMQDPVIARILYSKPFLFDTAGNMRYKP